MINSSLFSSIKQDYKTPEKLYQELNKEFNFDFDPCYSDNKVTWENNSLFIDWGSVNFVNPPYNNINKWVIKCYMEYLKGKKIVLLIPSRTDTKYFHNYILPYAKEIRFLKGRLKFQGQKNSAPFPSMIVIYSK